MRRNSTVRVKSLTNVGARPVGGLHYATFDPDIEQACLARKDE